MRPYEGMFLVHNKESKKELDYLEDHIRNLVGRAGGEVVTMRKWDDRKLAYEIKKQSHGIYYLAYFMGEGDCVKTLNRECELSDLVLRALFLVVDKIPQSELESPKEDESEATEEGDSAPETAGAAVAAGSDDDSKSDAEGDTEDDAKS